MANKYSENIIIPCYDADSSGKMKLFAFLNYAQEAANRHAELMGFGYETLIGHRLAWVLSRIHVKFHEYPKWKQHVVLNTWHKGSERLFSLRDFTLKSEDGELLVSATTSWLTLNLDTRRLVRDSLLLGEEAEDKDNALETPCDKVQLPAGAEPELVGNHEVAYSDIDFNGHANNAMYAFWAIDAIGNEFMVSHELTDFMINFNHETKAGDNIVIYRLFTEENGRPVAYVEGKVEGKSSFVVKCMF